jgi:hypothetical protein
VRCTHSYSTLINQAFRGSFFKVLPQPRALAATDSRAPLIEFLSAPPLFTTHFLGIKKIHPLAAFLAEKVGHFRSASIFLLP